MKKILYSLLFVLILNNSLFNKVFAESTSTVNYNFTINIVQDEVGLDVKRSPESQYVDGEEYLLPGDGSHILLTDKLILNNTGSSPIDVFATISEVNGKTSIDNEDAVDPGKYTALLADENSASALLLTESTQFLRKVNVGDPLTYNFVLDVSQLKSNSYNFSLVFTAQNSAE